MSIVNSEQGKSLLMKQLENIQNMVATIYRTKQPLRAHEDYLITHLMNYTIQLSTFQLIINGAKGFPTDDHLYIDYTNVNIVGRALLENYFTIHYLFFEDLNDQDVQNCKYLIYNIHGLSTRQNFSTEFPPETPEQDAKMQDELNTLQQYINQLQQNPAFQHLSPGLQQHLLNKKPSKMISITDLTRKPYFPGAKFYYLYKMYCNFAHTDFVSIMKMYEIFYNPDKLPEYDFFLRTPIFHTVFMNASLFVQLIKRFPSLNEVYDSFNEGFRIENEFWYRLSQ